MLRTVVLLLGTALATASTIVEIATAKDAPFTALVGALKAANLVEALSGEGPFTVFAPTDDAFKKLTAVPTGDALKKVLLTHVVKGKVLSTDLKNGQEVETLSGSKVKITIANGKIGVANAQVTKGDVIADNGVIHIIDAVIIPTAEESKPAPKPQFVTAVDIATSSPNFSTLVDLVKAAGLVSALANTTARFTVFAPTNEAFKALKAVPTGDALKQVLLYHVVQNTKTLRGFQQKLTTLQGSKVSIAKKNVTFVVNDANVLATVRGKNAVVYVIDKVLIPPPAPIKH